MPSAARLPDDAERLATEQHGYVGLGQLVDAGTTHGQLQGLVARGELTRVLPRTFRCRSANRDWAGDAMAALLWAGEDAALSMGSCARARAIDGIPSGAWVELTVPWAHHHQLGFELAASGLPAHRRIRLIRSRTFSSVDRGLVGPLRTTTVPRLLVDSAAVLRPPALLAVLDDVVGARKTVPIKVHRRALALRPGRKGVQVLVQATAPGAAALYRSWLERYGHTLLLRAGIQGFETNVPVYDGARLLAELDEYCAAANLPLEFDGLRFHAPARAARADRRRGNLLRARDIVPLRYTWLDLLDEPERYIADVERALRVAGCGHLIGEPSDPLPPLPPLPGTRR